MELLLSKVFFILLYKAKKKKTYLFTGKQTLDFDSFIFLPTMNFFFKDEKPQHVEVIRKKTA